METVFKFIRKNVLMLVVCVLVLSFIIAGIFFGRMFAIRLTRIEQRFNEIQIASSKEVQTEPTSSTELSIDELCEVKTVNINGMAEEVISLKTNGILIDKKNMTDMEIDNIDGLIYLTNNDEKVLFGKAKRDDEGKFYTISYDSDRGLNAEERDDYTHKMIQSEELYLQGDGLKLVLRKISGGYEVQLSSNNGFIPVGIINEEKGNTIKSSMEQLPFEVKVIG